MPKVKTKVEGRGRVNKTVKSRVGTRKTAKGAHQMSTTDLVEAYKHDTNKKHKNKINAVLRSRGVDINTANETTE
jgi:hypothetical protein